MQPLYRDSTGRVHLQSLFHEGDRSIFNTWWFEAPISVLFFVCMYEFFPSSEIIIYAELTGGQC